MRLCQSILVIVALAVTAAACSVSLKQRAVVGLQVAESSSGIAQDAERALYASGTVKALTPAVHANISRTFARIFQDEHDAAVAMIAWKSGTPAPASVLLLLKDATQAWAALQPLLADVGAGGLTTKVQSWIDKVAAVARTVNLVIPPNITAAIAYKPGA